MLFLIRGRQRENRDERILLYGFSCLLFGAAMYLSFAFITDFYFQGTYVNNVFYGDVVNRPPIHNFLNLLLVLSNALSLVFFFLAFETVIKKTKYIMTITTLISIVIIIISFNLNMMLYVNLLWFFTTIYMILLILVFIWIARTSRIEFQPIMAIIFIGCTIFLLGYSFTTREIKSLSIFPLFLGPLFVICGAIIMISPMFIDPKFFSESSKHSRNIYRGLVVIEVFYSVFAIVMGIFLFNLHSVPINMPISYFVQGCLAPIVLIYLINHRNKTEKRLKEEEAEDKDLLSVFAKPQKITEEEVTISKEKKICLVCKGKVLRINIYLCPECNTFYCSKCSEALSNLENSCWVCETPFDESKPVRLIVKKEEDVVVEGVDQKKNIKR